MKDSIAKLKAKQNLTILEIENVMASIMSGKASSDEVKEFLLSLNDKGPSVEEITAAAKVLRKFCLPVRCNQPVIFDTCGTGGDRKGTFNISTINSFVVAAAGITVAKHGNRSVSSQCGSADLLEGLGIKIDLVPEAMSACLEQVGLAFLFAQKLHPAMKNVAAIRKELGVKTIFNILGPLANPAKATHQVVGVYSRDLVEPIVNVLKNLGLKRALVVHGFDGLDEITTTAKTLIGEFDGEKIRIYEVDSVEYGIQKTVDEELKGSDVASNVRIVQKILTGEKGPQRDIVVLNAAFSLYIAQKVTNIPDGIKLAQELIDSGDARMKMELLKNFSQKIAKE